MVGNKGVKIFHKTIPFQLFSIKLGCTLQFKSMQMMKISMFITKYDTIEVTGQTVKLLIEVGFSMDYEQRESSMGMEKVYNESFHKLLRMFTLSILISFIGTLIGTQVPTGLFLPLVVVELIMMFSAFFFRRNKRPIGYLFVYSFTFISGITIYPTIAHYASIGGTSLINTAFILTVVIFGSLSAYAYYSKRDFSFLGGFLMVGLMTLVGFGIVSLFIGGFSGPLGTTIAAGGVLIFSGFILYDISRYRQGLTDENIPLAVLNLYLDFINLFLYLLRFLGISRD
ncbi:MAG: rane protein [Bacilli bacterium]|nr:rane protein [Bacilli bacterium]